MKRRMFLRALGIVTSVGLGDSSGQTTTPPGVKHQAILVHFSDHGFDPPAFTHKQGLVTLFVVNATRAGDMSLIIERISGATIQALAAPIELLNQVIGRQTRDLRRVFHLLPGVYRIRDTRNPDFRCLITITVS